MVVSQHIYTAVLIGSPDLALSVKGGTITLDAGRAPHVAGTLIIAVPTMSTLTALDPRDTRRIRVSVAATFPTTSQTRTFDLALRDRQVDHGNAEVTLTIASDESLLEDYAPLTDDTSARALEASLRDVVDYVLDIVTPGTALEASPSVDANSTRYWNVTNLLPNPSFEVDAASWAPGTGGSAVTRTLMGSPVAVSGSYGGGWTATATGDSNVVASPGGPATYAVTPRKWYVFTAYICSTVSRSARLAIQWWSAGGLVLSSQSFGSSITTNNTTFQRISVIAQAPDGATHGLPYVNTQGNNIGDAHYVDCAMFYEGDELIAYFDGASTDTAQYLYDWSNTAHASTSTRTAVVPVDKESLTWRAGQAAMDFLMPLVQVAGLRLVCDEERNWTLRDETYQEAGSLSIRHGVNLVDGTDAISRDAGIWHDAAVTTYTYADSEGVQQTAVDAYALTTPYTKLIQFQRNTPYPGPGFSEYAVRRAQGRGREVDATAVSDWTAKAEQPITIVLEGAPTQTGLTQAISYDLDNDEMTVKTRTLEIGAHSIAGLTGTIDGLTGTINGL